MQEHRGDIVLDWRKGECRPATTSIGGGGKSVIIGDPKTQKTEALLRAMGRLVETLSGRYVIADDVGTNLRDLAMMRLETHHTAATTASALQPLAVTAYATPSISPASACPVTRPRNAFCGDPLPRR